MIILFEKFTEESSEPKYSVGDYVVLLKDESNNIFVIDRINKEKSRTYYYHLSYLNGKFLNWIRENALRKATELEMDLIKNIRKATELEMDLRKYNL